MDLTHKLPLAPASHLHVILSYFYMALWHQEVPESIECGRLAEVGIPAMGMRLTSSVDCVGSPTVCK